MLWISALLQCCCWDEWIPATWIYFAYLTPRLVLVLLLASVFHPVSMPLHSSPPIHPRSHARAHDPSSKLTTITVINNRKVIKNSVSRVFVRIAESMTHPLAISAMLVVLNLTRSGVKTFGSKFSEEVLDLIAHGIGLVYITGAACVVSYKVSDCRNSSHWDTILTVISPHPMPALPPPRPPSQKPRKP